MKGIASERIPFGAHVLCRGADVRLASPEIANGRAQPAPRWAARSDEAYHIGDFISVEPIEGLGQRNLQALANGPIMDPRVVFLPAGRISESAYRKRLDQQFKQAGLVFKQGCN